eukprot:g3966.t1
MPKLGQLEAHLIRRVPNLKKMQMEKERLERVDLENARLLGRIKQLGQRKGREFSRSSAAEDVLPLVLKRRKRERSRKKRLLHKSNQLLKDRIDKIKSGPGSNLSQNNKHPIPPRHSRKKFQTLSSAKFSHRKFRLSNKEFDALIQSRKSMKNSSKSSISMNEKWQLVYKCGSRFQTNPVGAKTHRKLAMLLDRISLGIDRRTKALHKMFDSVDDDKSGFLTATELRGLMAKYSVNNGDIPSDADVMEFMDIIDENGDARLSKVEFVLFMLHNDDLVDETDSMVGKWRKLALESIPW